MGVRAALEAALVRQWWAPRLSASLYFLLPIAWAYGALVNVRRMLYRSGWFVQQRIPVPVVVVGNVVVGGAGKTPTVIALVQALRERGLQVGVISRGHGGTDASPRGIHATSSSSAVGDEPLLVHRRTGVPVWVGRDRCAAAQALLAAHPEVELLVSDDGLQHLRLGRSAQVIVFDERGAGNGHVLPAGPLREPVPLRLPPKTVVLYNAPEPSTPLPGAMAKRGLSGAVALQAWLAGAAPSVQTLAQLKGRPLLAVAGTAHPERFFTMLEALGLQIERLPLPDHYAYATLPWSANAPDVVVTEKDAIKLSPTQLGATRVWVVPLDYVLPEGFAASLLALAGALPRHDA